MPRRTLVSRTSLSVTFAHSRVQTPYAWRIISQWGAGPARMRDGGSEACRSCGAAPPEGARFAAPAGHRWCRGRHRDVQAGDGAVRRCGALDGHRGRGGRRAVARHHDRARGALGGGGAALRRDRGVHRRRGDGAVRRPGCVGGSCFSGVSCRTGHPGGGEPAGGRSAAPRRCGAAAAGGPEFGSGDRR